ncbi:MAG: hypothetical protein AB8F26_06625 [Phycisphaerales bacterium]
MRPTAIALIVAAASGTALGGDSIVQSTDFSWDVNSGFQITTFDAFDDAGGTRELTGVGFELNAFADWDVTALNFDTMEFETGEWFANGLTNFNVLFGDFGPDSVERISGAVSFNGLTGALGAGSGSPFGPPGDPVVSDSFSGFIGSAMDLDADEFSAFTNGPVSTNLISFTDITIDGPNGAPGIISVNTDALTSSGSLTLTYQYRNVPTPAAGAILGIVGLLGARRRR